MPSSHTPEDDPLRDLLVDAGEVDRHAITEVLRRRIALDQKSGDIRPLPPFELLDAKKKLLSILLARKAASLLGVAEDEYLSNGELVEISGLKIGTVAPTLKTLREKRLVDQDERKAYYVPNMQIGHVIDLFD